MASRGGGRFGGRSRARAGDRDVLRGDRRRHRDQRRPRPPRPVARPHPHAAPRTHRERAGYVRVADPPFKAHDTAATLDTAYETLNWTPNFPAAANEDHKGYNALIADAAAVLRGEARDVPDIEDGVRAMERLERMIALIET